MNRNFIIILSVIFFANINYGQKKASIKIKSPGKKIHYFYLPELSTDKPHSTYQITFADENNNTYKFGLTPNDVKVTDYLRGYKPGTSHFSISVKRTSHKRSSKPNGIIISQEKVKTSGGYVTVDFYNYQFFYDQTYKITIIDNLNNNEIIYDSVISLESHAQFPKDFVKTKCKKDDLSTQFTLYQSKLMKAGKKADLEIISEKYSMIRAFNTSVKKELNGQLSILKYSPILIYSKIKTKDKRFSDLDSIEVYFKEGVTLLKEQKENKQYINGHSKEVYQVFDKLYHLIKKYDNKEYYSYIATQEEVDRFRYMLRIDLFNASFFTSRYSEAIALYELTEKEYADELLNDKLNKIVRPLFYLSPRKTCLSQMDKLLDAVNRENRLFEKHKEVYGFYK